MKFTRCGLDIAKQVFQVHGVNEHGAMKGSNTLMVHRARTLVVANRTALTNQTLPSILCKLMASRNGVLT